jgi:EpsI family protein
MTTPRMGRRAIVLTGLMCGAAGVSMALRPTPAVGTPGQRKLENLIPRQFGAWHLSEQAGGLVSPDVASSIAGLYSETLARTYFRTDGAMVMLSLAYGENQSRESQIHKPEVCYAAQGFAVAHLEKETVHTRQMEIPVMRVEARMNARIEPITYWIRNGKYMVRGWAEQNMARLIQGLHGTIPDGLLVRVSSISDDRHLAYTVHDQFIQDMLNGLEASRLPMLLGQTL